jgi:predicted RNA-binding protein with PUA domain
MNIPTQIPLQNSPDIKAQLRSLMQWREEISAWKDVVEEKIILIDEKTDEQNNRIAVVSNQIGVILQDIQYRKWRDRFSIASAVLLLIIFIYIIAK